MVSLVSRFFEDWTSGRDPLQSRISVFEHIRDIPYSLRVSATDPTAAAEHILTVGKGNCGPKHYLLAAMYRKLGLDVVFATFPFLWSDPAIRYPPDLRRLAESVPVAYHLACRVWIKNRWVLVDATWDPPLAVAGFPVNEHWDGLSEMRCAVTPLPSPVRTAYCRTATSKPCRDLQEEGMNPLDGELNHRDEEERLHYYGKKTGMRTPEEIEQIARFYPAFDAWLEEIRKTSGNQDIFRSGLKTGHQV